MPAQTPLLARFQPLAKPGFWLACLMVVALSLTPMDSLPPQLFDWWDKAQHCIAFLVLAGLGFAAYPNKPRLLTALGLLLLGIGIEITQDWLGWRYGDVRDVIADGVGIAVSLVMLHRYEGRTEKSAKK